QPLRKTTLALRPVSSAASSQPSPYVATSDAAGMFSITGIQEGEYQLWAEHPGYLTMAYGAKHSFTAGIPLYLNKGKRLKDLTFRLASEAVLSGNVTDEEGDPLPRAQIQLLEVRAAFGEKLLVYSGSGR